MPRAMSTLADVDELDALMAGRLRAVLDQRGLRREDMARDMTKLGFKWTGNTVSQVITGRRGLSLLELAGVCEVLREPLEGLLGTDGFIALPVGPVDLLDITRALRDGDGSWMAKRTATSDQVTEVFAEAHRMFEEATAKAARRLGVTPGEIETAADDLWGRPFGVEREHRVSHEGLPEDPRDILRTLQARRGHAARALINELRAYFDGQRGQQP